MPEDDNKNVDENYYKPLARRLISELDEATRISEDDKLIVVFMSESENQEFSPNANYEYCGDSTIIFESAIGKTVNLILYNQTGVFIDTTIDENFILNTRILNHGIYYWKLIHKNKTLHLSRFYFHPEIKTQ
jgi:hypothetical protein